MRIFRAGSKKAPAAFNNQPSPTAAMVPGNWMFAAAVVQPAHTYQSPGNNEAMSPPSANGSIARSPEERRLRTPEDKRLEGLSPMQREIMRRTKQVGTKNPRSFLCCRVSLFCTAAIY
jgi:hypothetical protein